MNNDPTRITFLDHLLAFGAAALAVYSAGMGLNIPGISHFFIAILAVGTLFSYGAHTLLRDTKWIQLDSVLFIFFGIVTFFFIRTLNAVLPEDGFPQSLIVAAILCWLLAFWSFGMWRDSTLLFPCVPAVAIFSLVGSWDSYRGSTVAFFGFLLCFAMLFSRAQRRTMAQRARESGLTDLGQLSLGPWKWMAGPEWALGSAAAIVILSILGAPLLQSSVQGVAGLVTLNVPRPQQRPSATPGASSVDPLSGMTAVGRGPIGELDERPIFRVQMDEPRYLRTRTYDLFSGRGWRALEDFNNGFERRLAMGDENSLYNLSRKSIKSPKSVEFLVQFLVGVNDSLPLPGELGSLNTQDTQRYVMRPDGTVKTMSFDNRRRQVTGTVTVNPGNPAGPANRILGGHYNGEEGRELIPLRVRQFAEEATAGAKSDYDKARMIKAAIERQCKYNLKAAAVPSGENVVEAFLFTTREGYCDLFASAMTVCARAVGLPARYVQGYLPFDERTQDGLYVVRDADYHAWCEILFDDAGWVVMDATEGAEQVPGGERGRGTNGSPITDSLAFRIIAGIVAASVSFWVGWLGITWIKQWHRGRSPRREVGKLYETFARSIEGAAGRARRPGETPDEFFEAAKPHLGPGLESAGTLNHALVAALFSPVEPSVLERKEFKKQIGALRKKIPKRA